MNFYQEDIEKIFENLKTTENGLTEKEAKERLLRYGKNELPKKKADSIFKIFFTQILDPIVLLLIVTIIFSFIIGEIYDAIVVIFIVLVDLLMGTIQEYNAAKKARSLENIIKVKCKVLRDDKEVIIDSSDLVVGDIVFLESGNKVSADLRIIDSYNLTVNESILTGESLGVYKNNDVIKEKRAIGDRLNMVYAGCVILTGRATCVVVKTGIQTEIGQIAKTVTESREEKSPLTIRVEKFSKQISIVVLILAVILTIILIGKGNEVNEVFMLVVALTLSALPEGLPLALTMALTIASNRMLKKNVIVKKLNSVESLGSCTLIASDKTGTLTVNEQTAKIITLPNSKSFEVTGSGYNNNGKVIINDKKDLPDILDIIKLGLINNEASLTINSDNVEYQGDSIDVAFLALAKKMDVDDKNIKIIDSIPYESINKYSAVFYKIKGDNRIYVTVKGSPEKILEFSKKMLVDTKEKELDNAFIKKQNETLASEGYRVIALASGILPLEKDKYEESDIKNLVFKGLVGFIDPIRDDCKESIKQCLDASVKVIMITGDHPLTAYKIANDLGIVRDRKEVATSEEVEKALKSGVIKFDEFIKDKKVFARVTPLEKLEIVNSFKRQGEFVAVTGDGVNDAPAIKTANIGIAMGSGTDVSIETANMILTDDKFSSIVSGIIEGRCAYSNIRKITYMLISCGFAEVLFFILAIILNFPMPLLAMQLLWLNVVTDGLQDFALSFEAAEDDIMKYPPRSPKENLFDKRLIQEVLLSGITIGVLVFIVWYYLIEILNFDINIARGYIMALMVFIQNMHVLNCRSETKSIFSNKIKKNKFVYFSIFSAIILQIIIMEVPFLSHFFKTESIPVSHLIILFLISLTILFVMEMYKMFKYKEIGEVHEKSN